MPKATSDRPRSKSAIAATAVTRILFAIFAAFCLVAFLGISVRAAAAGDAPVRGLWVWKGPATLEAPQGAEILRDFCRAQGIDEIYISVSEKGDPSWESHISHLIDLMHRSNIRVEALLSSEDADEPGKHRETLLDHVRGIVQFNQTHPRNHYDGIHLDIEPQQRPENKGAGNLGFLPGLVDAYRQVRAVAEPAQLTVNADIQNKLLKGSQAERKMLLSSLPRITPMLYELSSPGDGQSFDEQSQKLSAASQKFLGMAFDGLSDSNLAKMVIALRTPDYGDRLPDMLKSLDQTNHANPNYAGWARHSYNDTLETAH